VPHDSLVDMTRLAGVDPGAFALIARYVEDHRTALARQVRRLVVARGIGLEGAVVAGFFGVLPAPFPVEAVFDLDEGVRVLARHAPAHEPGIARAITAAIADAAADDVLPERVRAVLRASPRADLANVAQRLSLSARTLQRGLAAAGTSMTALQAALRLELALASIESGDAPLTTIALDAGYASLQHMARAVRAHTGHAPRDLRARRATKTGSPPSSSSSSRTPST
jgi:AraC-like DNA-binding protein